MELLATFLILVVLPPFSLLAWRTQQLVWGKEIAEDGWMNRAARRWYRSIQKQKEQAKAQPLRAEIVMGGDQVSSRDTINDRLEAEFRRYRNKEISLGEYRHAVAGERDTILSEIAVIRARQVSGEAGLTLKEMELDEARDALEETTWRLQWIQDREQDEQKPEPEEDEPEFAETEKWARFDYTDMQGCESHREIVNWVDHRYKIVGYDLAKEAERTFRKERITNWVGSEELIPPPQS